jgi:hypothetical protein
MSDDIYIDEFSIGVIASHLADEGYEVYSNGEKLDFTYQPKHRRWLDVNDYYDISDISDGRMTQEIESRGFVVHNEVEFDDLTGIALSKDECEMILNLIPEVDGNRERRILLEKIRDYYLHMAK